MSTTSYLLSNLGPLNLSSFYIDLLPAFGSSSRKVLLSHLVAFRKGTLRSHGFHRQLSWTPPISWGHLTGLWRSVCIDGSSMMGKLHVLHSEIWNNDWGCPWRYKSLKGIKRVVFQRVIIRSPGSPIVDTQAFVYVLEILMQEMSAFRYWYQGRGAHWTTACCWSCRYLR